MTLERQAAIDCLTNAEASNAACWLCGRVIQYGLSSHHPRAPAVHPLVKPTEGGSLIDQNNLTAAHRDCARRAAEPSSRRW